MANSPGMVSTEGRALPGAPLFAGAALASRLESLAAAEMRRFAQTAREMATGSSAAWIEAAGGVAAYLAPGSPVNRAMGLGFTGPVESDQIELVEDFYMERGTSPVVGVCPVAHPSLLLHLSQRGWLAGGFENVLLREFSAGDASAYAPVEGVRIREALTDEDRDLWRLVAATGFSAPLPPLDEQLDLAAIVVRRPGTRLFLASVEGRVAGAAELYIDSGIAWLSADTTLPAFRRRGVQGALQAYRIALGAAAGCEMAVSEAAPGSGSQRNMERAGFRVAYTRLDMSLPAEKTASA